MVKHICVMSAKTYGGSYGVGDTKEEATKNARASYGKPAETRYYEVDVKEGRKLVVVESGVSVSWYTVPE